MMPFNAGDWGSSKRCYTWFDYEVLTPFIKFPEYALFLKGMIHWTTPENQILQNLLIKKKTSKQYGYLIPS